MPHLPLSMTAKGLVVKGGPSLERLVEAYKHAFTNPQLGTIIVIDDDHRSIELSVLGMKHEAGGKEQLVIGTALKVDGETIEGLPIYYKLHLRNVSRTGTIWFDRRKPKL